MNDIDKFKVVLERIVKNVITELCNPEDSKTDTEKAIDMSRQSMPTNNLPPSNNAPQKKKVLVRKFN